MVITAGVAPIWFSFILLLAGLAGNAPDIVSLIPTADYFSSRDIETSVEKMMKLASAEPSDPKGQVQQLLALRVLGSDPAKFKAAKAADIFHKTLEEIAKGAKAQGDLGFAREYAQRTLARIDGTKSPAIVSPKMREAFSWFPPDSEIVCGVDFQQTVSSLARAEVDTNDIVKAIPAQIKEEIYKTIEKIGNIEIDRLAFAELPTGDKSYLYFRIEGKFNPEWILAGTDSFDLTSKPDIVKGPRGETIAIPQIKGFENVPAIAFIDQTAVAVTYDEHAPAKSRDLLAEMLALRAGKGQSVVEGRLKSELQKIPDKALAVVIGEMQESFKTELTREFGVAPLKIAIDMQRGDKGFKFNVDATITNAADAKTGADFIAKHRDTSLAQFDANSGVFPGLPEEEIKNLFKSIQTDAKDTNLHVSLFIADDLIAAMPRVLGFLGHVGQEGPPVRVRAAVPIGP